MIDKNFESLLQKLSDDKNFPLDSIDEETKDIIDKMSQGKIDPEDVVEIFKHRK